MSHVDYLSRNPVETVCVMYAKNTSPSQEFGIWKDYQAVDEFCKRVLQSPEGYPEYEVRDEIVLFGKPPRAFVPVSA